MLSKEYRATMLESQPVKPQESNSREDKEIENLCNLESEHDVITGWTESDKKYFLLKHQFGSPKVLSRSVTQRNKHLLRCKINRSLNFDLNFSRKDHLRRISPNSSLDNSYFNMKKSSRNLTRSAKIMRALSRDISSCHRNDSIKKSLRFEPSPKKTGSSDESTSVDSIVNTPLHTPDKSLRLDRNSTDTSTGSSVPTASLESIDENQNRTPQQNRKIAKMLSNISDTKKSAEKSGSSGSSTSLLRSNMKERIDSITRNAQTPDFQYLKHHTEKNDRLRATSCVIAASTPRNLLKEFNNDEEDSPHTPKNVMKYIPEGMSSIKKSHKKERSYCVGRKALKVDDPVKNVSLRAKRTTESLEADDMPTSSNSHVATVKKSPKKSRSAKKALVYNLDLECSDNESISDDAERKAAPKDIDSSDYDMYEENISDIHDTPVLTSNHDKKENDACLQESLCSNVDLSESSNKAISYKSNSTISQLKRYRQLQDTAAAARAAFNLSYPTWEGPIGVRNPREKCSEMTADKLMETLDIPNVELGLILDRVRILPRTHERQAFENERPITPEDINSSRLLLSEFKSVKKSHKKDKKKNKTISDTSKYDFLRYKCKKGTSLLLDCWLSDEYLDESRNELLFSRSSSSDESSQKRKRFVRTSLQSDQYELAYSPESRCQNMDDEFKIYTPIRKRMSSSVLYNQVTDYVCRDKELPGENNKPTETTDATEENGRSTPVNMSTAELLCNIDSIKKSHKKDKHDGSICRKRIFGKKLTECTDKTGDKNVVDYTETSKDHTTPSLKLNPNDDDGSCDETETCSNTRNEDNRKSNEESVYDPQPSTSRESSGIEGKKDTRRSKALSTTPPNNLNTLKYMKLLHATSIKKSHKKERDLNAQSKYILMNHEYDLSDDGSIFDEEDKLNYVESSKSVPI